MSPTRATKNHHGRATWPWANLPEQHGRATHPCQATVSEPVKLTQAWEKQTKPDTVVCTHTPKGHGRGQNVRHAQIQNSRVTREKIGEHGSVPWPCAPKSINRLNNSLSSLPKNPNPSRCKSTRPLCHARSKASALPPSLRYLHAILAHMITGRRESTGIVNTHDACFLWCMSDGYIINLAYFIALAIQHQMERHRKGTVITNYDDPDMVQFCLGGLVCQLSIPEFGTALGLYTEELKEENDLHALNRHIHHSPSR
ncbi:hypothetical protein GOBAR_AA05656 [Gossypium barbadense]|uniref:Uncharacterized protein n=1 Tax=Gossypium barbadense TaxID=3634 RepID=A0A2P5YH61_GOSBA|nr:hypothetical protein GOBAR_AA05656 [Gossypium barbadense]